MELLKKMKQLFILAVMLCTCDPKVDLLLNGDLTQKQIEFACGTAKFSISSMGGHLFYFDQSYDLSKEVSIFHDSLRVLYKSEIVATKLFDENGKEVMFSPFNFNGKRKIMISFEIQKGVSRGDTITVLPSGYLYCSSERIQIDTINVIINRDF
jgi:hypothetical protein